jgi:hypothetical protein
VVSGYREPTDDEREDARLDEELEGRRRVLRAPEGHEFAGHAFCGECYALDPGDDYCWSCGEPL